MTPATRRAVGVLLALTFVLVASFHLFRLSDVPRGFYVDELDIGTNAISLNEAGIDEHGVSWPLYWESIGDFKSPIQPYAVTAVFHFLGASEGHLRLASALLFLVAWALFGVLLAAAFPGDYGVWIFGLIGFGFIPHYFTISRVAFEPIAELPFLVATLLLAQLTSRSRHTTALAAVTGVVLGASMYAYTTSRLFSPLMLGVILVAYRHELSSRDRLTMVGAFALLQVPLLVFLGSHPGALTARFHAVSYVFDPTLSVTRKLGLFIRNYVAHFSPNFLLIHGDGILRHTSGTGIQFWTTLGLALVGLVTVFRTGRWREPFIRGVIALMLLSPVPGALTEAGGGHVLRSLPLSLFLLLLACIGFDAVRRLPRAGFVAAGLCIGLLALEAGAMLVDYFVAYPPISVVDFKSAGLRDLLEAAYAQKPREIRIPDAQHDTVQYDLAYVSFYRRLLHLPDSPPLVQSDLVATPGTCLIYFLEAPSVPPGVQVSFKIDDPSLVMRLACFR